MKGYKVAENIGGVSFGLGIGFGIIVGLANFGIACFIIAGGSFIIAQILKGREKSKEIN